MKNIVKVLRYKDNAARLYELPDGINVAKGTLVRVEFPNAFCTCDGIAISDSYVVDGATELMVAQMHRIDSLDTLKRVVSVYDERVLDWPQDSEDAEQADG